MLPAVRVEGADHRQAFHHELRHLLLVVCALLGDLLMLLPEIVAQVDDRNARFLAPYLEYVGPLRFFQNAMCGSARCLARFSGVIRKG